MTPERYERLCRLFDQAQARPPDQRATFLAEVGDDDPALRADLESMLADDQKARGEQLLQQPCPVNAKALLPGEQPTVRNAPTAAEPAESDDTLIGRRVGPYLVEAPVGHGGMGSVYRALRQGDYRQRVALKVIRPGLGSDEVLRRFRTERQVLAELEHPHVARLLDGGSTDDGRPYFVMEYIDGQPLDRFCEARQLGTRERVGLLLAVCAAVEYAHGRGVLHRDLKPDNVLVTADGVPKVTDFGLAKRLEGGSGHTASGAILGTPSYMAPEQAGGKAGAIGPATDVYALGAILYELLTGRPPFRAETPLETLRQVLTEEPVPPRRLHLKLARDLETICLKCLEKDPARRYPTVAALADDLRRFQAGEPIRARPVGRAGRLWRWARRRPAVASLLVVSFALLAAGLAGVTWQWRRAEGQRDRAEQSFLDARAAVDEMLTQVAQKRLKDIPEMEQVRQDLLQKALDFYQKFLRERGEDASVRQEAARAYRRVGDIQGLLGHSDEAEKAYRDALDLQGRLVGEARGDPDRRQELAKTHYQLGALYRELGRTADAETEWQAALALAEELVAEQPGRPAYRQALADTRSGLGIVYKDTNRKDLAETTLKQARDLWAGLAQEDGAEPNYQRQLAGAHNSLSVLYAELGREDDADAAISQAIDAQRQLVARDRPDTEDQRVLGTLYHTRGWVNYTRHRPGPSAEDYEKARDIREKLVRRVPGVPRYVFEYVWTLNNLGLLYSTTGQWRNAAEPYQKALPLVEQLNHDHPEVAQYEAFYAFSLHGLGGVYLNTGRPDQAEECYKKALPIRRKVAQEHADIPDYTRYLGQLLHEMGMLRHEHAGKPAEAVTFYAEARAIREELSQRYPRVVQYSEDLAWTLNNLGEVYRDLGQRPQAEEVYDKALLVWTRLRDEHPKQPWYAVRVAATHTSRGNLRRDLGDPRAALADYAEALAILGPLHGPESDSAGAAGELRDAYWGRAKALGQLGRHKDALADWDRALPLASGKDRDYVRFQRAPTLAALGDHALATAEVEAAVKGEASPSGQVFFEMARVYALSAAAAGADAQLAERYAARAADLLTRAEKADYFQGDGRRDLLKDKAFDPLRAREEFKKLLDRVAQRAKS
jgi:serine/threonine-protein kinase